MNFCKTISLAVIIFSSLSLFYSEKAIAFSDSSLCYEVIPNSPQGNFAEVDVEGGTGSNFTTNTDSVNLKFWRVRCNNRRSTEKKITELFVTVTPKTPGESDLNAYSVRLLQEGANPVSDQNFTNISRNLFVPKSYQIGRSDVPELLGNIDFSDAIDIFIKCITLCDLDGLQDYTLRLDGASTTNSTSNISNAAGLWFDPALSGLGFNIIDTGTGIFVYYYGYKSSGEPFWLLSTDALPSPLEKNKAYSSRMSEPTQDEGASFSSKPVGSGLADWGSLTIQLNSCTSGIMTVDGIDGVQIFNVVKLAGIKGADCFE